MKLALRGQGIVNRFRRQGKAVYGRADERYDRTEGESASETSDDMMAESAVMAVVMLVAAARPVLSSSWCRCAALTGLCKAMANRRLRQGAQCVAVKTYSVF